MSDVFQVDPTLPQSAFPYDTGTATPGTPTGSEQLITASGQVVGKTGVYYLQGASAITVHIPAPVAGAPANKGDDGSELEFINLDGKAHVIQCGSGGSPFIGHINAGLDYKATFSGSPIGRVLKLRAYGGNWYVGSGATLS